jgi:hypothetical protein
MSDETTIDLFAEDRAHEEFLKVVIHRLAREENKRVRIRFRSARGGHGKAVTELRFYQKAVLSGELMDSSVPDLLFVAIDANCSSFNAARREIEENIESEWRGRAVIACPDPHIERWYLADKTAFAKVIGKQPRVGRKKCERDYYKAALANTIISAGYPATLGGIEFAEELVEAMDFYVAGKIDRSFKHFLDDARRLMKLV